MKIHFLLSPFAFIPLLMTFNHLIDNDYNLLKTREKHVRLECHFVVFYKKFKERLKMFILVFLYLISVLFLSFVFSSKQFENC